MRLIPYPLVFSAWMRSDSVAEMERVNPLEPLFLQERGLEMARRGLGVATFFREENMKGNEGTEIVQGSKW